MHVTGGDTPGPAPARRAANGRWRNPRLVLGLVLVLGSAVLGGWLLAAARDATDYWAVGSSVRWGDPVRADDLVVVSARVDGATARTLVPVAAGVPAGTWTRDMVPGALATRDAIADDVESGSELPLGVASGAMPPDLRAGQQVDVWATGDGREPMRVRRLATAARVIAVSEADGTGRRTLVVDAGPGGPRPETIAAAAADRLTVVRVR